MVEFIVLEKLVLGDRFLNCFLVKMANWVFDPRRRLNYMMEARGRRKKYLNDDERKEAQQKHALIHHYRKEALENYLKSNPNDDIITVLVNISSRVLGEFNEEIKYKKLQDGSYRKLHK